MSAKPVKPSNPLVKGYLVLYNAASCVGWAYVIYQCFKHFKDGGDASHLWKTVGPSLKIVQTAAMLEIFHAAFGLVRSSAVTAFIQVMSRLIVLWGITNISPPSQTSVYFPLMCFAWSLVEVPRYLFYIYSELGITPPYALEWLRYSLFIVLYPAGITGEIGNLLQALPYVKEHGAPWDVKQPNTHNFAYSHYYILLFLLSLYVPGSPYMIGHMWDQRKKKLGGEKAKVP